jgi:thiamine-phosphate pyrophosphorylase
MPPRQTALPHLWLVSDARNDAGLEGALKRLPPGSGFIFRHYHLPPRQRRARFETLRRIARARRHTVILAGDARQARRWGADGAYGPASVVAFGPPVLRLISAHSAREVAQCRVADAILLSPMFATRSHPGAKPLGIVRWRLLARLAQVPVIALGGMTPKRARTAGVPRWAAIDGFVPSQRLAGIPRDS